MANRLISWYKIEDVSDAGGFGSLIMLISIPLSIVFGYIVDYFNMMNFIVSIFVYWTIYFLWFNWYLAKWLRFFNEKHLNKQIKQLEKELYFLQDNIKND